jgi:hypothetical protein
VSLNRRRFCGTAAATFAAVPLGVIGCQERSNSVTQVVQPTGSGATAIRPFPKLNVPQAELDDLRGRIKATRWPSSRALVPDQSQELRAA